MVDILSLTKVLAQEFSNDFAVYNGDCVPIMAALPADSIHYAMWSPAFKSLYTFSDSERDLSNNPDDKKFWAQYAFTAKEIFRIMKPGRLITIHCMDLPTSITRDGFIGMRDFPGDNLRLFEGAGFVFHSRAFIRKDPVSAMQRSKAIGLLHKQIIKDSALGRMAIGDQLITMRKPGLNDEPVSGIFEEYHGDDMTDAEFTRAAMVSYDPGRERTFTEHKSIEIWQRYAEGVWMDINQSDVLSKDMAREDHDERHISPLQLTPIKRCLEIWTNPGDVVFSPFSGIGSVGCVCIEMGRKFLGAELKPSYYRQAVANLKTAELEREMAKNELDLRIA